NGSILRFTIDGLLGFISLSPCLLVLFLNRRLDAYDGRPRRPRPPAEYRGPEAQERGRDAGTLRALLPAVLVWRRAGVRVHRAERAEPGRRAGADRRDGRLLSAAAPRRLLVRDYHAQYVVRRAAGRADRADAATGRSIRRRLGAHRPGI